MENRPLENTSPENIPKKIPPSRKYPQWEIRLSKFDIFILVLFFYFP
jgi:hypothetical protein